MDKPTRIKKFEEYCNLEMFQEMVLEQNEAAEDGVIVNYYVTRVRGGAIFRYDQFEKGTTDPVSLNAVFVPDVGNFKIPDEHFEPDNDNYIYKNLTDQELVFSEEFKT